jgi:hypothetical protein
MSTARARKEHDLMSDEEGGVILSPKEEADLERAIAESDEDERAGRLYTLDQVLADLRRG